MNPALLVSIVEAVAQLAAQLPSLVDEIHASASLTDGEKAKLFADLDAKLQATAKAVAAVTFVR